MKTNIQTKPYRPSNGSEGMEFMGMFCEFCIRELADRPEEDAAAFAYMRQLYPHGCPILAATLGNDVESPDYPIEWVYDDLPNLMEALATSRCTAFVPDGYALAANAAALVKKHADAYLIWSYEHQAWWKANSHGYTLKLEEAGRYSKEEARKILLDANATHIAVPGANFRPPLNEAAIPIDTLIPSLRSDQ